MPLKSGSKPDPNEFQSLQVVNTVFRECFTPAFLPVLQLSCFSHIAASVTLILFHAHLTPSQIIVYYFGVLLCSFGIIFMLGLMNTILEESQAVV